MKHHKTTGQLRIEWQEAQTLVEELQDALERDEVEEGRLEALKKQLAEAEDEKGTHESSYEDSVLEKDRLFKALKCFKEQMANLDKAIEEAEAKLSKAEQKAAQRANKREDALREKNNALEVVERAIRDRQDTQRARDDKAATVENFKEQAGHVSDRVPIEKGETCGVIEEKLTKMNADLKKAERRFVFIHAWKIIFAKPYSRQDWWQRCSNCCGGFQNLRSLAQSESRSREPRGSSSGRMTYFTTSYLLTGLSY